MILVTGGTGLVGAHLLYHLSLQNNKIRAIYRNSNNLNSVKTIFGYYTKNVTALYNKIEWIKADILDISSLEVAFKNVSYVYHVAALVSFEEKDYRKMRKVNIEGTANIVNFCIDNKIKKLCYVSSIATIEKLNSKKQITEESDWNGEKNNYGYAITKYGAELEVWRGAQEGLNIVIVNPGVIIGPGFWQKSTGMFFTKIKNGFNYYTTGITGFVGVNDVVKAMLSLMASNIVNKRYLLVSENKSFKEILSLIAEALHVKKPSIEVKPWLSELLWRIDYLKSKITGKKGILSKNAAQSSHHYFLYSSAKIKRELQFEFEPIDIVIQKTAMSYPNLTSK